MCRVPLLFTVFLAAPATADPVDVPLDAVFALAQSAYLGEQAFADALSELLPISVRVPLRHPVLDDDPMAFILTGTIGGQGAHPRPGAIFTCGRYGLHLRDMIAERGFTAPETFAATNDLQTRATDLDDWPPDAVAVLNCHFSFDDTETMQIIPRAQADIALAAHFDQVFVPDRATSFDEIYGQGGYHLDAREGARDSVVWVDYGSAVLTTTYQYFGFRAFVLGGGV